MALRYPAERILIRCPNWIGDAVAATAAIRCMRRNYPDAHITLLLSSYVRPALENAPWFNEVIEFDRRRNGGIREILRVGKRLRQSPRYDLALLLTHSFSSALVVWLGRSKFRVGHARNGRSWLLTKPVPWPCKGRTFDRVSKVKLYSGLLECLGCEGARDQRPELFTSEADEKRCDELFKEHRRDPARPLLAIVPGAAYGSSKLWEPAHFAAVANAMAEKHNMQAAILTGPGERATGQKIARSIKQTPIIFAENELTFGVLKVVVQRSALMLCNDTGPRHVAIAYNIPVVVLMGPTGPSVTHSDYERTTIVRKDVPCAPCFLRTCPTDHRCMTLIAPAQVIGACEDMLQRYGEGRAVNSE